MPSPNFFRHAGLFVVPTFLDEKSILELCTATAAAPTDKALVVKSDGIDCVAETVRKVQSVILPTELHTDLRRRLMDVLPRLEKHFHVQLGGCESPDLLIYRPNDFFTLHSDGGGSHGHSEETRQRRVSAVIFLNRESAEPEQGTYGHGQLTFYGLLDGSHWEKCGFPLSPEPGLLVAFPSEMIHEVTPVSHGRRLTIVTWFYARNPEPKSETVQVTS